LIRFYASSFAWAMAQLGRVQHELESVRAYGARDDEQVPHLKESLVNALAGGQVELDRLPLSNAVKAQWASLLDRVTASPWHLQDIATRIAVLIQSVMTELDDRLFLMIPEGDAGLYSQPEPLFGAAVASKFPECDDDIKAAGRCLAIAEWTASVFHLMRALEHGLRWLAGELKISMLPDIDLLQWGEIIDQIESESRNLEKALPRGRPKSELLQFYGEAATNFAHFKTAWRNHVMHSRSAYDPRQTRTIYAHVDAFLRVLADHRS